MANIVTTAINIRTTFVVVLCVCSGIVGVRRNIRERKEERQKEKGKNCVTVFAVAEERKNHLTENYEVKFLLCDAFSFGRVKCKQPERQQ